MSTNTPLNILIFSKTTAYRHTSIPAGIRLFEHLAKLHPSITLFATEDAENFTPENLSKHHIIVLLQTLGPDLLNTAQLSAFRAWMQNGGGVVAIHGAAAGMPENEWWGNLIGAKFLSHPEAEPGTVVPETEAQQSHFIMGRASGREGWNDEWYNFHSHPRENKNLAVLLKGDPKSFKGGMHGDDHPLVWCQEFEGGRVFFTALGHFDEAYEDEWFRGLVERGLFWAARREGALMGESEKQY